MDQNIKEYINNKLSLVPKKPGCYQMYNKDGEIIYVGKAKILQNRLKSYFTGSHDAKTTRMLQDVVNFEYIITHSELEAFLLEANFIKKNRPKYNILLMDDKTYPYIILTDEQNPRLLYTRDIKKEFKKKNKYIFGPYPNAKACKDIVEIINKAYPFRKCNKIPKKKCLYAHLGQCLAPCENNIVRENYEEYIKSTVRFLNGNDSDLVNRITELMNQASIDMRFEEAIEYRDLLTSIDTIIEKQTMEVSDNIPRDIFGYFTKDGVISIQVLHMRMGKIIERNGDVFDLVESVDDAVLSYIYQFYDSGANIIPKEIIIPYLESSTILEELLNVKITVPVKGIKKQLLDNVMSNAKNNIETLKKMRLIEISKTMTPLVELSKLLNIKYPKTIELFDNSNIQGVSAVSAMVKYIDGKAVPKEYRKYKVKTVTGPDDYHTMMEVIERRYKRLLIEKEKLPSLIIVDGGKTQIKACLEVLDRLGLRNEIDVIGLLKDDRHKTRAIMNDKYEEILINKKSDLFLLLESMQDEVHRFAITFFKKTHSKNTLTSILDDIEGLGTRRKNVLLENFETIYDIKNTTTDKLKSLGIPVRVANNILNRLNEESNQQ